MRLTCLKLSVVILFFFGLVSCATIKKLDIDPSEQNQYSLKFKLVSDFICKDDEDFNLKKGSAFSAVKVKNISLEEYGVFGAYYTPLVGAAYGIKVLDIVVSDRGYTTYVLVKENGEFINKAQTLYLKGLGQTENFRYINRDCAQNNTMPMFVKIAGKNKIADSYYKDFKTAELVDTKNAYKQFLRKHPKGIYTTTAQNRMSRMKR